MGGRHGILFIHHASIFRRGRMHLGMSLLSYPTSCFQQLRSSLTVYYSPWADRYHDAVREVVPANPPERSQLGLSRLPICQQPIRLYGAPQRPAPMTDLPLDPFRHAPLVGSVPLKRGLLVVPDHSGMDQYRTTHHPVSRAHNHDKDVEVCSRCKPIDRLDATPLSTSEKPVHPDPPTGLAPRHIAILVVPPFSPADIFVIAIPLSPLRGSWLVGIRDRRGRTDRTERRVDAVRTELPAWYAGGAVVQESREGHGEQVSHFGRVEDGVDGVVRD